MAGACSTLEFIEDVRKNLGDDVERFGPHFDRVIASRRPGEELPLCRTIAEFVTQMSNNGLASYNAIEAAHELANLSAVNCHNGQRKLTVSVLEFIAKAYSRLSAAWSQQQQQRPLVVYAGASGLATVIAATIFPGVDFVIYDKADNTTKLIPKNYPKDMHEIFTEKHAVPVTSKRVIVYSEWFDDEEALKFSKFDRPIWFISDVRINPVESDIAHDMRNQQRWAVLTGCDAYMFKFRLPYDVDMDHVYTDIDHMLEAAALVEGASIAGHPLQQLADRKSVV